MGEVLRACLGGNGFSPAGVTARDALHAAAMGNHDLARIISTDTHFDQIEGIVRLDPQRFLATNSTNFHE